MSVFVNNLKTFKTKIIGEELELKVVAGMWLFLESEHGIKQSNFNQKMNEEEALTLAKLVHATLKANRIDVTLEEVLYNTDDIALAEFFAEYTLCLFGDEQEKKKITKTRK